MLDWMTVPEKKGFAFSLPTSMRRAKPEVFLFSPTKEIADGIIVGMFIGGVFGMLQGMLNDCRGKELCKMSGNSAINGATIGAITAGLSCILFSILLRIERNPTFLVK